MAQAAGCYKSGRFIMREKKLFTAEQGLDCEKINCLLIDAGGRLLAGTQKGLFALKSGRFSPLFAKKITGSVSALCLIDNGTVAIAQGNSVYYLAGGVLKNMRTFDSDVISVICKRGYIWVLTEQSLICTDYELKTDKTNRGLEGGKGICMGISDANMYVATDSFISLIHGKRNEWKNIVPRFSQMPDSNINSLDFDSNGYLWMGTKSGSVIYDAASRWIGPDEIKYLPKNPVYKTAFDKQGGVYFATDIGVAYLKNGSIKYFTADRWIPDNKINDIAVTDDGSVIYAATDKGISAITSFYTTLSEKAEVFEQIIEKYHIRRSFTAARSLKSYNMDDGYVQISDNDGLWTACYVAAESFRYAATGSKEALDKARRGMKAMLLLTKISGIPGFTARAVRYKGEEGYGNGDPEWHLSPDKSCEWKGETSSDEMTGHFFGLSIYHDLCANAKEKKEIKAALCGIMDHIIRNNYRLVDADGLPTTWACWDPTALNYDERWFCERGINSLEILGFLKTCANISGDKKYDELYKEFISKHRYPLNAMRHKIKDGHTCHIDDNLAFLATLTFFRQESNEAIRSLILCGMEDHWEYERTERQPMFAVIHAALTGRDADIGEGIQSLREIPYDLINYPMENSKRNDLEWDTEQAEWYEDPQVKYALPYDERNVHRPDGGAFQTDCPFGRSANDPTIYLLPYWIGRYYGIIAED